MVDKSKHSSSEMSLEACEISLWISIIQTAKEEKKELDENAIKFLDYQEKFYEVYGEICKEDLTLPEFQERLKAALNEDIVFAMQALHAVGFSSQAITEYLLRSFRDAIELYAAS